MDPKPRLALSGFLQEAPKDGFPPLAPQPPPFQRRPGPVCSPAGSPVGLLGLALRSAPRYGALAGGGGDGGSGEGAQRTATKCPRCS